MTFGHVVIGRNADALELTRVHERVHVQQCERLGPAFIPVYLLASAWASLRGKDAYNDNYFERQARAVEMRDARAASIHCAQAIGASTRKEG